MSDQSFKAGVHNLQTHAAVDKKLCGRAHVIQGSYGGRALTKPHCLLYEDT